MSTAHFAFGTVLALVTVLAGGPARGQEGPIKPFKDELFSQTKVLQTADDGAYEVIDYQKKRDMQDRDVEEERRVKGEYVSTGVKRYQQDETLTFAGRKVDVTRVGRSEGAAFTVIFIHGQGGDRKLGVNDYMFGGNFNRLKNLSVGNDGTYYSVSVPSFDEVGAGDVASLVRYAFEQSAGRPVILACASMGSIICQHISRSKETVRYLGGMVLLGGPPDPGLRTTPFAKLKLPLYIAHGGADNVYKATDQIHVYQRLHKARYPVRFTLFETGGHGTPIRMVDWRKVLNFELTAQK